MNKIKKLFSLILCITFTVSAIAVTTGCSNAKKNESIAASDATALSSGEIGEGKFSFVFTVTDTKGTETEFTVNTNKTTVGDALKEVGLIDGEDSQHGLYVKTVNGTTLDYNRDGKYWAFYINGEYATSGVDKTEIEPNTEYAFKAE